MNRKLKFSKRFTPCPVDDGDELYPNGIFVFNITKMAQFIEDQGIRCEEVLVKDYPRSSNRFNEDHLPSVDVTRPVIVAEIAPGRYNVIDGNHRLDVIFHEHSATCFSRPFHQARRSELCCQPIT